MAVNAINSGQGSYNEPYVSAGTLIQVDNLLGVYLQRDERLYLDWMEYKMNYAQVSDFSVMRWHEDDLIRQNAHVGSIVSGGATPGAPITITIADHYSNNGANSPFRQNDTIKINRMAFFVQLKNTSTPNAHTLTIVASSNSTVAGIALNTVIVPGMLMVPTGNQYPEGTGFQEGYVSLPQEFQEICGITKTKNRITGTQGTDKAKIPFAFSGKDYIIWEADIKTLISHKGDFSYQCLLGDGGTAAGYLDDGVTPATINVVKGGVRQTQDRGTTLGYFGAPNLNDIYNLTRIMVTQGTGDTVLGMIGHELRLALTTMMTNQVKEGGRVYMNNDVKRTQEMMDFDFEALKIGSQTLVLKNMIEFNHPTTTYVGSQAAPYYGWFVPDKEVVDNKTGARGYTMQLGYKKAEGPGGISMDRKFQFKITGWNAPVYPTSEIDEANFTYLTEGGIMLTCANQTILMDNLLIT